MNNLCTVSDINYLHQGLALYDSLNKTSNKFTLHYLCLDNSAYDIISKIGPHIKAYHIDKFLAENPELVRIKNNNYSYFCWLLASYFSNKLLPKYDSITYIDSDIFFHRDIQLIFDEVGSRDVGIFRHRQFPLDIPVAEGSYNVGVVHFKNTEAGQKTLAWWTDAVLNKKYPELATCGDQKYLDHFPNICESIYIDENIGHGAPWQWQMYEILDDNKIVWEGATQDLVFTHFSSFKLTQTSYIPALQHRCYTSASEYTTNKNLKVIYDEYYSQIKSSINFYMS
tara:strand:+ start:1067 stop:1915 length:849 start_codon:yes stop_codon:yes gene_type:complete